MDKGHETVCNACGNELRSVQQQQCHSCGMAVSQKSISDTKGDPEQPRMIAGMTPAQLLECLVSEEKRQREAERSE